MNTGPTDDRLAIRELIEHYCNAVNQRDAALWGANWAEDSEWNLPVVPGMESVKGKAAIDVVCNPLGKSGGALIQQVRGLFWRRVFARCRLLTRCATSRCAALLVYQFMILGFGSLAASTPCVPCALRFHTLAGGGVFGAS